MVAVKEEVTTWDNKFILHVKYKGGIVNSASVEGESVEGHSWLLAKRNQRSIHICKLAWEGWRKEGREIHFKVYNRGIYFQNRKCDNILFSVLFKTGIFSDLWLLRDNENLEWVQRKSVAWSMDKSSCFLWSSSFRQERQKKIKYM